MKFGMMNVALQQVAQKASAASAEHGLKIRSGVAGVLVAALLSGCAPAGLIKESVAAPLVTQMQQDTRGHLERDEAQFAGRRIDSAASALVASHERLSQAYSAYSRAAVAYKWAATDEERTLVAKDFSLISNEVTRRRVAHDEAVVGYDRVRAMYVQSGFDPKRFDDHVRYSRVPVDAPDVSRYIDPQKVMNDVRAQRDYEERQNDPRRLDPGAKLKEMRAAERAERTAARRGGYSTNFDCPVENASLCDAAKQKIREASAIAERATGNRLR